MRSRNRTVRSLLAAAALAVGGVAFAQPFGTQPSSPPQGSQQCPCMGGSGGMMGGMGGGMMQGQGQGMMGGCPSHRLSQIANMQVEQTNQGAVVRFTAKDPSQVNEVHSLAQSLGSCACAAQQAPQAPAGK